ncbi:elongation of very long chain fatty acids protein AAEL008004 [Galendromus occidentalis]|uniref:Elongation of very long chain fatty acids protein n=1 Tax=Galendromus occidentalis TaxID=34638 RepID=A0AAJ6QLV8_9ACAR|nr:elongation of very long chain fatty acids protein AAEL008004 [Galendromus occidentalis]
MTIIVDQLQWFHRGVMENTDPRVADWPLMGNPASILMIVACYVYFVKILGPNHMKERKAYRVKNLIIAYNVFMVLANAWFFLYGGSYTYLGGGYSWFCEPANYGTDPKQMTIISIGWWYMLLKIVELMDTVFFVLTKKFSHITLLHVIHHSLVASSVWFGVNFGATGQNAFFPLVNCVIHCVMYAYYAMAALGLQRYLWWKRYLTLMQMSQFISLIIHGSIPVFYDCGFPPYFGYLTIFEAALFFGLFFNFYMNTYKKKPAVLRNEGGVDVAAKTIKAH